ncbi:hypothetical protein EB796_011163 [Bugula neritina]|uniref:Uncharacterized protein n=1 Tax=Bugula neritina TaxID=10212 RepID=A0A7J7JXV7_BUGNE|nr:hypothetical protein EB796_011163 [Bugula neritina]
MYDVDEPYTNPNYVNKSKYCYVNKSKYCYVSKSKYCYVNKSKYCYVNKIVSVIVALVVVAAAAVVTVAVVAVVSLHKWNMYLYSSAVAFNTLAVLWKMQDGRQSINSTNSFSLFQDFNIYS